MTMETITVKCFSEMGGAFLGSWRHTRIREAARQAKMFRNLGYYVTVKIEAGPVVYQIWG
jgi:hypothetical protein